MARHILARNRSLTRYAGLFVLAGLASGIGIALSFPGSPSVSATVLFVVAFSLVTLVVFLAVGSVVLRRVLVRPMEQLSAGVRRIADGDYVFRIGDIGWGDLDRIRESVNQMADRLIADQRLLAANVESLEATNKELIEMRDQVLRTARLASVGTLAAGIAHEVGNPLGAIMAYVDVARARAQSRDQDTELLESIRDEARRIDRIVRSLLDWARPQSATLAEHAPGKVLERVRDLLEAQGKLDRVADRWEIDDVPYVVMEPQQLEQVLVNLLLNALDALESTVDPEVSVRLSSEAGDVTKLPKRRVEDPDGVNYMHRRRISRDDDGRGIDPVFTADEVVVIEVSDNGPGIDADLAETVFDPFFTTKDPGKGTGLGLSICARLVEGMGGRITVGSGIAGGAVFSIQLPAAAAAVRPGTDVEAEGAS
jgi:two-component system, NtrC family, sensor kinase